jgi:hypothetical protein
LLGASIACGGANAYDSPGSPPPVNDRRHRRGQRSMKKLLIILILAAIGIAVAKKVREA